MAYHRLQGNKDLGPFVGNIPELGSREQRMEDS